MWISFKANSMEKIVFHSNSLNQIKYVGSSRGFTDIKKYMHALNLKKGKDS